MASFQNIPYDKVVAIVIATGLVGGETWLNGEFVARSGEGWASSPVYIVVIASVSAAAAPCFMERSYKAGDWAKFTLLVLGFLLMVGFSFGAGVDRIGTKRDNEASLARTGNERTKLDREAYDAAKKAAEAECIKNQLGKKCRTAEQAETVARERLRTNPVQNIKDHLAARMNAVLGFVSSESVALYFPLFLPGALQLLRIRAPRLWVRPKTRGGQDAAE